MRQIVKNYYTVALKITGTKSIAYFTAIAVVTILSMITIGGLAVLLSDILPTKVIVQAISFPFIFISGTAVFVLNMLAAPQSRFINKDAYPPLNISKILLSISIPFIIYLYTIVSGLMK